MIPALELPPRRLLALTRRPAQRVLVLTTLLDRLAGAARRALTERTSWT